MTNQIAVTHTSIEQLVYNFDNLSLPKQIQLTVSINDIPKSNPLRPCSKITKLVLRYLQSKVECTFTNDDNSISANIQISDPGFLKEHKITHDTLKSILTLSFERSTYLSKRRFYLMFADALWADNKTKLIRNLETVFRTHESSPELFKELKCSEFQAELTDRFNKLLLAELLSGHIKTHQDAKSIVKIALVANEYISISTSSLDLLTIAIVPLVQKMKKEHVYEFLLNLNRLKQFDHALDLLQITGKFKKCKDFLDAIVLENTHALDIHRKKHPMIEKIVALDIFFNASSDDKHIVTIDSVQYSVNYKDNKWKIEFFKFL